MPLEAKRIFQILPSEDYSATPEPQKIDMPNLTEGEDLRLGEVEGSAGIAGYSNGAQGGLATNRDLNPTYRPALARGSYRNHGLFHQGYLESASYQRAVRNIVEGLTTGFWSVEPFDDSDESKQIASKCESILFGLDGGWERHVEEALYFLISGFSTFLKITDGIGQIKGLSFRFSHTVSGWVTDENQSELIGIKFTQPESGGDYLVPASELLLYQLGALGNDFEGLSPMRSVYSFIQAHQLFSRLEALAAEKFGGPIAWVSRDKDAPADSADDAQLIDMLDNMVAADNPILLLQGGYSVNISSPQGQMPDFDAPKRYCDEQVSRILQADGALLGSGSVGSYALAAVKDDVQLRSLSYYASLICRVVNGEGSRAYTGLIRHIVDVLTGHSLTWRGRYPRLRWSLSPQQDDGLNLDQIVQAHQAGFLDLDEDDKALIRAKLGLPPRSKII